MLSKAEIIEAIKDLTAQGTTQTEIAEVMGVAPPRISELLHNPSKRLTVEEAKRFVDHYRVGEPVEFNLDALAAILRGLIEERVAPQVSDQVLEELAAALRFLLVQISADPKRAENLDGLTLAARAAVARPARRKP